MRTAEKRGGQARCRALGLLLFAALTIVREASAQQLIVNGGFEQGTFTETLNRYEVLTQGGPQHLTGWTIVNSLVWGFGPTDINTRTGSGFVDFTGVGDTKPHGGLSQVITTVVGQQYNFSAWVTLDFRGLPVPDRFGMDVFANGTQLTLAGTPGFWDYSPTGATYGQLTSSFFATSTSTTMLLSGRSYDSQVFMIGVDDVSVLGPSVITPEPGTAALLAGGFAVLLAVRRRRTFRRA